MSAEPESWSVQMDRKLKDMKEDPAKYFERARTEARREVRIWVKK